MQVSPSPNFEKYWYSFKKHACQIFPTIKVGHLLSDPISKLTIEFCDRIEFCLVNSHFHFKKLQNCDTNFQKCQSIGLSPIYRRKCICWCKGNNKSDSVWFVQLTVLEKLKNSAIKTVLDRTRVISECSEFPQFPLYWKVREQLVNEFRMKMSHFFRNFFIPLKLFLFIGNVIEIFSFSNHNS